MKFGLLLSALDKSKINEHINFVFDRFKQKIDDASSTPGVSEGVETRLNIKNTSFYGLSHNGQSVHQSILTSNSDKKSK